MSRRNRTGRLAAVLAAAVVAIVAQGAAALAQDVCSGVSPVEPSGLQQVLVAQGVDRPVLVLSPPGDTSRIFIVEQAGTIRVHRRGAAPTAHSLFLDISGRVSTLGNEMGLLGMAFDPRFGTNGRFYLSYTTYIGGVIRSTVRRFNLKANDPTVGDPASEHEVITFQQPGQTNHNGGHIVIGPDDYLYLSAGDGGGANDSHGTCGNGQDTSNLLGTILRIDPLMRSPVGPECSESGNYSIPAGNPLGDGPGGACDEIWHYGLRNPWRFAFDGANGDLYIADVGQNCWEEIDYVPASAGAGRNFGWRSMEGLHCFNPATPFTCQPSAASCADAVPCGDPSLTAPVAEYGHAQGCSISGGFVYRGCRMPGLAGTYFYGDYCTGFVRSLRMAGGVATEPTSWDSLGVPFGLSGFGEDAQGELYVLDHSGDKVYKILPFLRDVEVSGAGAADRFLLDKQDAWTWEDLTEASGQPVDEYRVYRRDAGSPDFACVHTTAGPAWPDGGDTTEPAEGQLLSYLVTAAANGAESSPGGTDRTLAAGCP